MIDYMNPDDDDIILPDDPQFDAWIERAAPMLNVPPATPRGDMWDAIVATQAATASPVTGVIPFRRSVRRWAIPASIAAALLLGIAIDRAYFRTAAPERVAVTVPTSGSSAAPERTFDSPTPYVATGAAKPSLGAEQLRRTPSAPTVGEVARPADEAPGKPQKSDLYRLAAVQTLSQAEAFLTAYRASGVAERDPQAAKQLGAWGREVLSSTRLLIDSPAGDDPALRSLFNDLEVVLVQIIRLSGTPLDASERALIDDALRSHDLLPRIRTAVPAGVAGAATDN
ncbi:MAG: hypothetical protein ABIY52_11510 [Gemmatimonadaceae bacterium]